MNKIYVFIFIFTLFSLKSNGQKSYARIWNEALLEAIRNDDARPTVHARNLFHISAAMYDVWAVYKGHSGTYFIDKNVNGYRNVFEGFSYSGNLEAARNESISYAVYRIMKHRFKNSIRKEEISDNLDNLMEELGYDIDFDLTNYHDSNSPAALGNYVAKHIIAYGLQDGSNEVNDYQNTFYAPVNTSSEVIDPNRWQPIRFRTFVGQSDFTTSDVTPEFISPEWGIVKPFSLTDEDLTIHQKEGNEYWVYHDPGPPPFIDSDTDDQYKWGFSMVVSWNAHLDPSDSIMWDISPKSIGNIPSLPETQEDYSTFYKFKDGGDNGVGRSINPITNTPYKEQIVPRADYARVLAEFWADGPDSETPPGHWFTLLNYVSDNPSFEKRFSGKGEILDDLEWDVKSYFALGGAMHDAAISAWGIKGYYDYVRPRTSIIYMGNKGQSSDPNGLIYSKMGLPLIDDLIEINEGSIVVKRKILEEGSMPVGPVEWDNVSHWQPYQRTNFITPPFAGYVSGHSTFSRAAAVVMTKLTGSEFFPNGLGEFHARKNEFLVADQGPSVDVTLQWATYEDAADQCSLSRIWGGIHPPADDIPGRKIGDKIGNSAFELSTKYFRNEEIEQRYANEFIFFPNPAKSYVYINIPLNEKYQISLINSSGKKVFIDSSTSPEYILNLKGYSNGNYIIDISSKSISKTRRIIKQ